MRIVLTGADGFLGWHTRVRLRALTGYDVLPVTRDNWGELPRLTASAGAIIHVAGVNRGDAEAVRRGNERLAEDVAAAVRQARRPVRVVYANTIQAGSDTPYGVGKAEAGEILSGAVTASGGQFVDVRLPNLFGEHARPHYNSFVATFVHAIANGEAPTVKDRQIDLLHVQDAAQALLDGLDREGMYQPTGQRTSVRTVYDLLRKMHATYRGSDIPPLTSQLEACLFNSLRAALFPQGYPFALQLRADRRGELVEAVRSHGGQGQTFISTTKPGYIRGEHFHLQKMERFAVLRGRARISLRQLFKRDVVSFDVSGETPSVVDMPTMWAHRITNIGDQELITLFWTDTLFDTGHPDTYPERVIVAEEVPSKC